MEGNFPGCRYLRIRYFAASTFLEIAIFLLDNLGTRDTPLNSNFFSGAGCGYAGTRGEFCTFQSFSWGEIFIAYYVLTIEPDL